MMNAVDIQIVIRIPGVSAVTADHDLDAVGGLAVAVGGDEGPVAESQQMRGRAALIGQEGPRSREGSPAVQGFGLVDREEALTLYADVDQNTPVLQDDGMGLVALQPGDVGDLPQQLALPVGGQTEGRQMTVGGAGGSEVSAHVQDVPVRCQGRPVGGGDGAPQNLSEGLAAVVADGEGRPQIGFLGRLAVQHVQIAADVGVVAVLSLGGLPVASVIGALGLLGVVEAGNEQATFPEGEDPRIAVVQRRVHDDGGTAPGSPLVIADTHDYLPEGADMAVAESRSHHG